MAIGVGGSTIETELKTMVSMRGSARAIDVPEYLARIARAQSMMREARIDALWLDASSNLTYFTGLKLHRSERLHGAVLPAHGELVYVTPAFEEASLRAMLQFGAAVATWHEHEDPTILVADLMRRFASGQGTFAIDEATPFFTFDGLHKAASSFAFVNGATLVGRCRMIKSAAELALMQTAHSITMEVHRRAARILYPGITTTDVQAFIVEAHRRLGASGPPAFNAVQFGEATAYPHGVPYPQTLHDGDMVLIDVGAPVEGYLSDITRTYVFGTPTARQRQIWNLEKTAQNAGFAAAQLGEPCEHIDAAARGVIEAAGFGPGYALPGLPHRTGHGIGLDVHERPYIVRGDTTQLQPGMTFSIEPMICIYEEFGVRLEDHIYMTASGPCWFTQPAWSIDDPFGQPAPSAGPAHR